MMTQAGLWTAAGVAALVALISGIAEWRRDRRRDLDRIGWVPWQPIQVLAFGVALVSAALAIAASA